MKVESLEVVEHVSSTKLLFLTFVMQDTFIPLKIINKY